MGLNGVTAQNFATCRASTRARQCGYKFAGAGTSKILEGKKIQNSARFQTTFNFEI